MPRGSAPIIPRGFAFRICLFHRQIHGSRRRAGARVSSEIFSYMAWGFFLTRGYRKRCWDFIVSGSCDSGLCPYSTPRLCLPYLPLANTRLSPSRWGASTWLIYSLFCRVFFVLSGCDLVSVSDLTYQLHTQNRVCALLFFILFVREKVPVSLGFASGRIGGSSVEHIRQVVEEVDAHITT